MSATSLLAGAAGVAPARALSPSLSRVRPGHPAWPSPAEWDRLGQAVEGRLIKVKSPLAACAQKPGGSSCDQLFKELRNPYFLGDEPGLTQTLGWVDGWTSRPSVYAVAAQRTSDVVAAVNFARARNLRLVVKGGGHSYQGTSNAADSLLIWTRRMNAVLVHDGFVAEGCEGIERPQPAVSVEAGALWGQVYDRVTTRSGRYVQGGGCLTVGVAGLVQSGGFGSFSKAYGPAAASLLEAEIVTADGEVRIANRCMHQDLFWALKGGGGGSFGVVTRMTLRTHALPKSFGAVFMTIEAASDDAFKRLIRRVLGFYRERLYNPLWGEQLSFRPGNVLDIMMLFQGMDQPEAMRLWRPFLDGLADAPQDYRLAATPTILVVPAQSFWDPSFLKQLPGIVLTDNRPRAPQGHIFWAANLEEAGQVLHGYRSAWLPAALLEQQQEEACAAALHAASRHWSVTLHVNKGIAGAPAEAIAAAADTALNPAALDAFALLICAAEGPPAYPGVPGHEPDQDAARRAVRRINQAMAEIQRLLPNPAASYLAESDYFEDHWQQAFWGSNYGRLLEVKDRYDPQGLFIVHHGVGSERWSPDGFARISD